MWYEWITNAYLDRRCTGRFRGSRGVQVVRAQTGGATSTRTCQGRKGGSEVAAQNRSEWRQSVAQWIHLDAGWIKVKVKVYCWTHCWFQFDHCVVGQHPSQKPARRMNLLPLHIMQSCSQRYTTEVISQTSYRINIGTLWSKEPKREVEMAIGCRPP